MLCAGTWVLQKTQRALVATRREVLIVQWPFSLACTTRGEGYAAQTPVQQQGTVRILPLQDK